MSALDEMIENARKANEALKPHYKWQNNGTGINLAYNMTTPSVVDPAKSELAALRERVDILEAHLQFAVNNKENFTEYDPDGVIISWIRSVQVALKGE